jgi:hypothetical protein
MFMGVAMSIVALGVVVSVVAAVIPVGMIWVLVHADEIGERALAAGRKLRLVRPPTPVLTNDPPIERIAADLRRLSIARQQIGHGTPAIRRRGVQLAYEAKLEAACRALGVPHALDELADGMDREIEKMRIEAALENAGLRFRSRRS